MIKEAKALSGAEKLLSQCLALSRGADVAIFCDETTTDVATVIATAARKKGINHVIVYEPTSLQIGQDSEVELPWLVLSIINRVSGIVICLSNSPDCLSYRKRIIQNGRGASRRIGHMPGATILSLIVADVDYAEQKADCYHLAIALALGHHVEINTMDASGRKYTLEADLGGLDQSPVASDGIIPSGSWGNIPGGEAYIAPIAGTGQGQIVINVALPELVLERTDESGDLVTEEVLLTFENGMLTNIATESSDVLRVFEKSRQLAVDSDDQNWCCLAEIGIGVSKSIRHATGVSLIDEKMYGTTHVAIGDNLLHGGSIKSAIHQDMITRGEVLVDGEPILKDSRVHFNRRKWLRNYSRVQPVVMSREGLLVRYSGNEYAIEDGKLFRRLGGAAGHVLSIPVGDSTTSKLAARVLRHLTRDTEFAKIETLADRMEFVPRLGLLQILELLYEYRLLESRQ